MNKLISFGVKTGHYVLNIFKSGICIIHISLKELWTNKLSFLFRASLRLIQ